MTYPTDRYGLIRRTAALDAAHSDSELNAAVRRGGLLRLVPGVYVGPSGDFEGHEGAQKLHRLKAIAVATSAASGGLPLSHASAAGLHNLSLLKPDIQRVHMVNGKRSGGCILTHRHIHAAPVPDDELTVVDGITVTTLERTAVDVATSGDFAQALTAFDQALRAGADPAVMEMILSGRRRRGVRVARRALAFADGASESVGESWSRAQIIGAGLPLPRLQHEFRGRLGTYRFDFDWDEKVVGEFDGMVKYERLRKPGTTIADAVIAEKRREDDLRAHGLIVVRWTWAMLEDGSFLDALRPWLDHLGPDAPSLPA